MRSMTFLVNDRSTGSGPTPTVAVTVTENADGSVSFSLKILGPVTGDLRGFFFDLANESLIGSLSISPTSSGFTEFRQGNDSIKDLGTGANMNGLLGSDGGYDAGVEIGTAGDSRDDYQTFSFTISSSTRALTLDDFANVDFGVRVNSVGTEYFCDERDGEAKLLETVGRAMDAKDDAGAVTEDAPVNQVTGNVFANDLYLTPVYLITAVNGSAADVGDEIEGIYGTFRLNLNGSYTYTLDNSRAATQTLAAGQIVVESFTYSAKSFDELTSSSSDTATVQITITGADDNAAPVITAAVAAGAVTELADNAAGEGVQLHSASGTVDFADVNLTDSHTVTVAGATIDYLGAFSASITNPSAGDGAGQVTWEFSVSDDAVEHLGAGESLTQNYSLTIDDGHGGVATQAVTITITGSNDAPVIIAAGSDSRGLVFEDGARRDSGQIVAEDVDENDALSWSVSGQGLPGQTRVEYHFLVDNLSIERNGDPLYFNDDFGNNAPPPSGPLGPVFPTFIPTYFLTGGFTESGGRAVMDSQNGVPGAGGVISNFATLNSDTGPNMDLGLKSDDTFKVEARFDLVLPDEALETYGLRLSDVNQFGGGDDFVDVIVRKLADGSLAVLLREAMVVGQPPVTLATIPLTAAEGDDQIVFRLEHAANTDVITASFDLLNYNAVTATYSFGATVGHIFGNESWTRPQVFSFATATPQNGKYGYLSVDADGEWHYALSNAAANVQALAQGEHDTDTFTVTVRDQHGAFDMETVTVDVHGSNDAPVINNALSTLGATISEDAIGASGRIVATDVDHGAQLEWSVGRLGFSAFNTFAPPQGYQTAYNVSLNQLTLTRNGDVLFDDTFSDFSPPPSAPDSADGPLVYLAGGAYTEFGKLNLDGTTSGAQRGIGNPELTVGHLAVLGTNIDAGDADHGLKSDDDFEVEARFDLIALNAGYAYGISLTDNANSALAPDQLGDSNVSLLVRSDGTNLFLQFNDFNVVTDVGVTRGTRPIVPQDGENQIVLRLVHDKLNPGIVHAEFDLVGPSGTRTQVFGATEVGHIFGAATPGYAGDDENWTRAQIVAFGPDQFSDTTALSGQYGTLSVQQDGSWNYQLNSNADSIGQGMVAFDSFAVRVTDEHGVSSFRQVNIQVNGANDAPLFTAGSVMTGEVVEDLTSAAVGVLLYEDPDMFGTYSASSNASPANTTAFGSFQLGPVNPPIGPADGSLTWTYDLNATAQSLAQGQTMFESYTVRVTDNFNASAAQDVTITITGTNDAVTVTPGGVVSGEVEEDADTSTSGSVLFSDVDLIDNHTAFFFSNPVSPLGFFHLEPVDESSLTADGSVTWTYTLNDVAAQVLASGQTVIEVYTVTVQDSFGGFATQDVVITIHGADEPNTPPIANPDTNAGDPVVEFGVNGPLPVGDPSATGNVLTNDVDADPLYVSALNGAGAPFGQFFATGDYGSLTMQADGTWNYTLEEFFHPEVNALAQGEVVFDDFTYTVTDSQGASSQTTLSIAVTGANDVLTLQSSQGSVIEDGVFSTSGQLIAVDPDHAAVISYALGSPTSFSADYHFALDQFVLTRFRPGGLDDLTGPVQILNDDFTDNVAPPSSPPYSNGQAVGYGTRGPLNFTEGGGRVFLDGALALPTFNLGAPGAAVTNSALALTTVGSDLTAGLRLNHVFDAMGRFDAILPQGVGQAYGIEFTDQNTGVPGDDHIQLLVRRDEDGTVRVVLREADLASNSTTLIDSLALGEVEADDQILLRLMHDPSQPGAVTGAFEVLDDGVAVRSHVFDGRGQIYGTETPGFTGDDELFTRAQFLALSPADPQKVGAYGRLTLEAATGEWRYNLDNNDFDVQALAQGQTAHDVFQVFAFDQFNVGQENTVTVEVTGTNDLPTAAGGLASDTVVEDEDISASGALVFNDVDLIDTHFAYVFDFSSTHWQPLGTLFLDPVSEAPFSVDGVVAWSYSLHNQDAQFLAAGQTVTERYTVAFQDPTGAQATQDIVITIHGQADAINLPPVAVDDMTVVPVVEAGHPIVSPGNPFAGGNLLINDFDPDGSPFELRVTEVNGSPVGPFVGTYGTLSVTQTGTWSYGLNDGDPDTDRLPHGLIVSDQFAYTVADAGNATDTGTLTVEVRGSNDAPVGGNDFFFGVNEDAPVSFHLVGNDLDVDLGAVLRVGDLFGPNGPNLSAYGATLTINPDGTVQYNPGASAQLQALNAGETLVDTFSYTVLDEHGAQGFATVSVQVLGANDGPVAAADGTVFEDGIRRASGELELTSGEQVASVAGQGTGTLRADYRAALDNLNVIRAIPGGPSLTAITDDFANNNPGLSSGNVSWTLSGSFIESNGRLAMDGGVGVPSSAAPGFLVHAATLNTDTGPDATQGLKKSQTFIAEARFDLSIPDDLLEGYSLRLTDAANDIIELTLRRVEDGNLAVVLREADAPNVVPTELSRINLTTIDGDSQINLRLFHSANADFVTASFDVLDDKGLVTQSGGLFPFTAPDIFTGEDWTRVQITAAGPTEPQNGRYGTLSVEADGDWSYQLANSDPNVQALAQGETAVDTFTVTVNNGMGGTRTEEVSVEVVGSNDQPLFPFGLSAAGGAYVVENGRQAAGGFAFANDADHGADMAWSVRPVSVSPYTTSYHITLDELSITRNGDPQYFRDEFNDGVAPTNAGAPAGYAYLPMGGFSESGGRLVLNGQAAAGQRGTGFDQLMAGHLLTVGGIVQAGDDTLGLRIEDDFQVSARFDLATLQAGQSYGFSLTDNTIAGVPQDQFGDDVISVEVANVDGTVVVRFVERDVVADTLTEFGTPVVLDAGSSTQIELKLSHSAVNPGQVTASFDLLNGLGPATLAGTGHVFNGEDWTRVQVIAIGPDQHEHSTTAQGAFGAMTVDADTGAWNYVVNNAAAMEALNHNQVVNDNFNFRITDQYGVSTSRTMSVAVVGTGDPVPGGPITFFGNSGNDTVVGTNQNDTFLGSTGADLMVGLAGADRFDYNGLNEGGDAIGDFTPGVGGDILDLQTLLAAIPGYVSGVNARDYVQIFGFSVAGQNQTQVSIDPDGVFGPATPVLLANLYDTNQTYDSLVAGGNLIV